MPIASTQSEHTSRARFRKDRDRRRRAWEAKARRAALRRGRHHHSRGHRRGHARRGAQRGTARRYAPALALLFVIAAGALVALLYKDLSAVRADLLSARQALQAATADPGVLRTDTGLATVGGLVESARSSVATARDRATGSLPLRFVGLLPVLKAQRSGLLHVVDDSAVAVDIGRDLLGDFGSVEAGTQLQDGAVPLNGLRGLQRNLAAAATSFQGLRRTERPWGPVGDAREKFDDLAGDTASRLAGAADALDVALPFVGEAGDRRYLIAIQNNAEMRDQGMVLSYAVIRFTSGRLAFERNGSIGDLALRRPAAIEIPPGTAEVFGPLEPTTLWHSVNATADFAWSGQAMKQMYREATGEQIDGVIGIDVVGLQRMLAAVGPVAVEGINEPVTAENAARILLHDLYEGLPPSSDQAPRRERLSDVVRAVVGRLTSGTHDAVRVGRELGTAAEGGHVRLWSDREQEEEVFVRTGLGGGPAEVAPDRTFHIAVQNRTATKLDYYVTTAVRKDIELTPTGDAIVRTTVTVVNGAPVNAAPSYQLGPDRFTERPGDYLAWVVLWSPEGSQSSGSSVVESGLPLSQVVVSVRAGERKEVEFPPTVVPNAVRDGQFQLRLVPQPRLQPASMELNLKAPGWHVSSPLQLTMAWDRVLTPTWNIDG